MNAKSLLLVLAAAGAMPGVTATLFAAGYNKAEFTRLQNQVNVLKGDETPRPAAVGQEITNVTSVATGPDSRAELRFPDKSLTRIGANSRFTLKGDGRTLDLEGGVMMLQVPKKMGGAKVRTAAVTAAVTGTTVLFEYLPGGFVKLICVEGSVDLSMNKNPSQFVTLNAGQMIIMKADGKTLPQPVDVDLATLLKSSKLISSDDLGPNANQINQAMQQQQQEIQEGNLVVTNMVIEGRGTLVSLNNNTAMNVFKEITITDNDPPNNPPNNPGGGDNNSTPPGPDGPKFTGIAPLIAGTTVLNDNSTILTNPHVQAYNVQQGGVVTSEGIVYNGLGNGLFQYFTFGSNQVISPTLQPLLNNPTDAWGESNSGDWAVFKFEKLVINGTPYFEFPYTLYEIPIDEPIRDVILASQNGVVVGDSSQFTDSENPPVADIPVEAGGYIDPLCWGQTVLDLRNSGLDNFMLYAQTGDVVLRSAYGSYVIRGYNQNVSIVAAGTQNDVVVEGNIYLESGSEYESETLTANLNVIAGRDVNLTSAKVRADDVNIEAGQDVNLSGARVQSNKRNIAVTAKRHINITNSSTLKALSYYEPGALVKLVAQQGDINISDSCVQGTTIELEALLGNINLTNTTSSGDVFKATTLGANGWITIGGSNISANTLIQLYAEGATGGVKFIENTTLNSSQVKIAGKTVEIVNGKVVSIPQNNIKVFSDAHNYNTTGFGNFSAPPTQGTFGARHTPD